MTHLVPKLLLGNPIYRAALLRHKGKDLVQIH